jgi:hypothetical protein
MKNLSIFIMSIILLACGSKQTQENNKSINEVINALEEVHPYNLSPDKTWMIDLNYENKLLKSYTITQQGGEEITIKLDSTLPIINPPKKVEYSWIKDEDLGAGFEISSIGFIKNEEQRLVIFKDGLGQYTSQLLEVKK